MPKSLCFPHTSISASSHFPVCPVEMKILKLCFGWISPKCACQAGYSIMNIYLLVYRNVELVSTLPSLASVSLGMTKNLTLLDHQREVALLLPNKASWLPIQGNIPGDMRWSVWRGKPLYNIKTEPPQAIRWVILRHNALCLLSFLHLSPRYSGGL